MTIVVMNITVRPIRKKKSAIFSNLVANDSFGHLIDKNESMQLAINDIVATAVHSSIMVDCFRCKMERDVKTRKQSPNKLEEVFNMWVDLFIADGYKRCLYGLIVVE